MSRRDSPDEGLEPITDVNPIIKRGRVDSVNLYEVKESELDILEKGATATLQFSFAIFLFSIAVACIVALLTCEFKWETARFIFIVVSIVGIIVGIAMLISSLRSKQSIKDVVLTIRSRIDEDPAQGKGPITTDTVQLMQYIRLREALHHYWQLDKVDDPDFQSKNPRNN